MHLSDKHHNGAFVSPLQKFATQEKKTVVSVLAPQPHMGLTLPLKL